MVVFASEELDLHKISERAPAAMLPKAEDPNSLISRLGGTPSRDV